MHVVFLEQSLFETKDEEYLGNVLSVDVWNVSTRTTHRLPETKGVGAIGQQKRMRKKEREKEHFLKNKVYLLPS